MESPRTRFLKSPYAAQLVELVEHPAFIAGCDAALLVAAWENPICMDAEQAARARYRLEGAKLFLIILTEIGIAPKPTPKRTTRDNLEP